MSGTCPTILLRVVTFALAIVMTAVHSAGAPPTVGCSAEWHEPKLVLMHTPGDELFLGVLHPAAALFERSFDIQQAASEHRAFIKRLQDLGVKVHTLVEALIDGTVDDHGRPLEGRALKDLRDFAKRSVRLDTSALDEAEHSKQHDYVRKEVIEKLHPRDLVKIILQQPKICLKPTDGNTYVTANYELSPLTNLYFLRDQLITTSSGVVIGRMNSPQRATETEVIEFVLRKLEIMPMLKIKGRARLEGGDFLPAGDTAFLGQGLRTNSEALRQMLEARVFGTKTVVVVKDSWQNQDQMHLDTYFNILGPNLAVLSIDRYTGLDDVGKARKPTSEKQLMIDVYELTEGGYMKRIDSGDFQQYLEKDLKMTVLPVSNADQANYGINFLAVGPKAILGVDGVSQAYKDTLERNGVKATWMDLSNLKGGYGAAHCCTQAMHRVRP